jgi:hypothetical protein
MAYKNISTYRKWCVRIEEHFPRASFRCDELSWEVFGTTFASSTSTCHKALRELVALGAVKLEEVSGFNGTKDPGNKPVISKLNIYTLNKEWETLLEELITNIKS